jgi:RNA polymerase sigma-70 factor (ECF subfamily)
MRLAAQLRESRSVARAFEAQLISACQDGDREAFGRLFEIHGRKVFSIALRFSRDTSVAMDIVQDTFLKLFSSIRDFRGGSTFETWVYRSVVNRCIEDRRRTRRFIPNADELLGTLHAPGDNLADILGAELQNRVRTAVEGLSPELRIAVLLRYTEELSYDEIAAAVGCAPGTVASRLNRAHRMLRQRLATSDSPHPVVRALSFPSREKISCN